MNDLYPFYEKVNDFTLDETEKSFEKISSISNNKKSKDNIQDNVKHQRFGSMKPKVSPKLSLNNNRLTKIGNSIAHEDLTEITFTDAITEPPDSPKSNELINDILRVLPKSLGLSSKNNLINNENFILLSTENYFHNYKTFPIIKQPITQRTNHISSVNFPLLKIDNNENLLINNQPIKFQRNYPSNENIKFDFFVSPEQIIQTKLEKLSHKNCKNPINEQKIKFPINEPGMVLKLESSSENLSLNKKENLISACVNENFTEDITLNLSSNSEIILYNGYNKIDTGNTKSDTYLEQDIIKDKNSIENNNLNHITNEGSKKLENKNNIASKTIEKENDFKNNDNDFKLIKKSIPNSASIPIDLHNIPILPPDILGQVHLQTGNNKKHFIGIRSIDEAGWNELINVNMTVNNNDEKLTNDFNEENFINTNKISSNFQKNLNESFGNIDNKISKIQKISFKLDEEISNKKMVFLDSDRDLCLEDNENESIDNEFEKPVVLAAKYEQHDKSKSELSLLTESSVYSSDIESLNISSRSFIPKLNIKDFDSNIMENISYTDTNDRSLDQNIFKPIKPHSVTKKPRFRNEIEKSNYLRRKFNGKKLALQVLNQLGLPSSSSEIPIKIIKSSTANEMMFSAYKRNQHSTFVKPDSSFKSKSFLKNYTKTTHKPFQEKVKLQRPEITRRKNHKPFAYSESLTSLRPRKKSLKNSKITKEGNLENLHSETFVLQDTDVSSVFSDWSVPQKVNQMLYNTSHKDTEELSQIISIQSNSVIDWDQISEMIKSPTLK